ncbi:hypothetical protein LPN04_29940 [Rugamonas sp. A1-17]|nr:hypothetical protein [Rugamonas sp. A1-17]
MNSFMQATPDAQVVLDSHASVVTAIEHANKAIIDVVRKMMAFDDALAENLMGCNRATLQKIADMSPSRMLELLHTSVPIFTLRLAEPEFDDALNNPDNANAALQALLKTFGAPVSLKASM